MEMSLISNEEFLVFRLIERFDILPVEVRLRVRLYFVVAGVRFGVYGRSKAGNLRRPLNRAFEVCYRDEFRQFYRDGVFREAQRLNRIEVIAGRRIKDCDVALVDEHNPALCATVGLAPRKRSQSGRVAWSLVVTPDNRLVCSDGFEERSAPREYEVIDTPSFEIRSNTLFLVYMRTPAENVHRLFEIYLPE